MAVLFLPRILPVSCFLPFDYAIAAARCAIAGSAAAVVCSRYVYSKFSHNSGPVPNAKPIAFAIAAVIRFLPLIFSFTACIGRPKILAKSRLAFRRSDAVFTMTQGAS